MERGLKNLVGLFLVSSISSTCLADIIFIDFNNSASEVKYARAAAEKRGEKLIVLGRASDGSSYNSEAFSKDLNQIQNSGAKLTSMIISGHDGNGEFFGSNGSLTSEQMRQAFSEHKELASNVRSIFMAGCYGSDFGAIETYWKGITPNASLLAGYGGSGPRNNVSSGWNYLGSFYGHEKELLAASDKKSLQTAFNKLAGKDTNRSLCSNDIYVNNNWIGTLADLKENCVAAKQNVPASNKRIICYLEGDSGCENPPSDTKAGELRVLYNESQKNLFCESQYSHLGEGAKFPPSVSRDRIIRLILFKDVVKNTMLHHADLLKTYDSELSKSNLAGVIPLGDLSKLSRAELVHRLKANETALTKSMADPLLLSSKQGPSIIALKSLSKSLDRTLRELDSECVPFDWVEVNSRSSSTCLKNPDLAKSGAQVPETYQSAIQSKMDEKAEFVKDPSERFKVQIEYLQSERIRLSNSRTPEASDLVRIIDQEIKNHERPE